MATVPGDARLDALAWVIRDASDRWRARDGLKADFIAAAVAAHLASDAVVREVSRGICATICGRRPEDIEDDVINEFMDEARAAISGALGEHEGVK